MQPNVRLAKYWRPVRQGEVNVFTHVNLEDLRISRNQRCRALQRLEFPRFHAVKLEVAI